MVSQHPTVLSQPIALNLTEADQDVVNHLQGFYGIVGPDVNIFEARTLYDLLLGNGVVQGVFFDRGQVNFVRHKVRTEKAVYEQQHGSIPPVMYFLYFLLHKLGLCPNLFGLANTAMVTVGGSHYVLYERDLPYEMIIDWEAKRLTTGEKLRIPGVRHVSAHPKVDVDTETDNTLVESIDYDIFRNKVYFHQFDQHWTLQNVVETPVTYVPVIHDFVSTRYNYFITDAPLAVNPWEMHRKAMPISLMKNRPTRIRRVNKRTGRTEVFESDESFFVFHYAQIQEDEQRVMLYAPVYTEIDFSDMNLHGKYRRLVLDKATRRVTIETRPELEELDMDFPVPFEDKVIFRNMRNGVCEGFVICRDLEIVQRVVLEQRFVYGEPRVVLANNEPYLITLVSDTTTHLGHVLLIHLRTFLRIEIPLHTSFTYGFHSFFVPTPLQNGSKIIQNIG